MGNPKRAKGLKQGSKLSFFVGEMSTKLNVPHHLITVDGKAICYEDISSRSQLKNGGELNGKNKGITPQVMPKFNSRATTHLKLEAKFELVNTSIDSSPNREHLSGQG